MKIKKTKMMNLQNKKNYNFNKYFFKYCLFMFSYCILIIYRSKPQEQKNKSYETFILGTMKLLLKIIEGQFKLSES